jgi:hypothetical protein
MEWWDFVLEKKDFSSRREFGILSYDHKIAPLLSDEKKYLVVFNSEKFKENDTFFMELLTPGDGSCFFYATQTIGSIAHKKIMLESLKSNLRDIFSQIDLKGDFWISLVEFATCKNGDISTDIDYIDDIFSQLCQLDLIDPIALKVKNALLDYKSNICGIGIAKEFACSLLEKSEKPTVLHVLPLSDETLEKISMETGLTISEIQKYDHPKEIQSFNLQLVESGFSVEHILFHSGHFSRLLSRDEFNKLQSWSSINGVTILTILLDGECS